MFAAIVAGVPAAVKLFGTGPRPWRDNQAPDPSMPTSSNPSRLLSAIDDHRAAMSDLLAELVAVPTENPPGVDYTECLQILERAIRSLELPCERVPIRGPDGIERFAMRSRVGRSGPPLCFHGHYDVVPAQARSQFSPRAEGDTLYGRGSSDMKSGLVAMLYAANAVRTAAWPATGTLELLFVPDEEAGGAAGTGALAAAGLLAHDAIAMLLPEPTSGRVWHANRGALTLEVVVRGRAAHVGLMHQGINAFERALRVVSRLQDLGRELEDRGSILLIGGRVEAGTNFNVVPDICRFTIDRRVNPDEDYDAERRRLLDLLDAARADGVDLQVRVLQEGRTGFSSPDGMVGAALAEAVLDVTGVPAQFEICPGLLETRFYAAAGVPAFAYGPGILAVSHGPQEFVRISRMIECAKIYALTAARLLARADRLPRRGTAAGA
jgi:succinyl-diaminopimelate desuccinylase